MKAPENTTDPLDEPLLWFADGDPFTIRDACEGIQIFGGTGSGKTSGSGAYLARAFLQSGFGGLVLCAKAEEVDLWKKYAAQAGRSTDLEIFNETSSHRFNVLAYESALKLAGAGNTENIVGLFQNIAKMAQQAKGQGGANEDFWQNEFLKLLRNSVEMLRLAKEEISLHNIHKMITTAAMTVEEMGSIAWQSTSFHYSVLLSCVERHEKGELSEEEEHDFGITNDYWQKEFARMDPRPRSSVISFFTGMADALLRGTLYQLFNTTTTIRPEDTFNGKIIVLDLPLKRFNEVGTYAQAMFKYSWQRCVERRKVEVNSRPVFIWIDESQLFVNQYDVDFQTTARGSRVSSIYLTQNLPNYLQKFGRSEATVYSLLGNLVTKIFHNNTCEKTNEYACKLFSSEKMSEVRNSTNEQKGELSFGQSFERKRENFVEPLEFSRLAKGGPPNDLLVEAFIYQGGKVFQSTGSHVLRTCFKQS